MSTEGPHPLHPPQRPWRGFLRNAGPCPRLEFLQSRRDRVAHTTTGSSDSRRCEAGFQPGMDALLRVPDSCRPLFFKVVLAKPMEISLNAGLNYLLHCHAEGIDLTDCSVYIWSHADALKLLVRDGCDDDAMLVPEMRS